MASDRTLAQRLLSPIAEVRAAEVRSVVLMAMTMLLLLAAYYMLKTARESLILAYGGAEVKTYSSAGQAVLLLILIPIFGALASRVPRAKLVGTVTLFFVINLVTFALFGRPGHALAVTYFLWVGIFNTMVIAQFWGFANDLYTPDQGKRLFPVIGLGSNLGAWLGSSYAGRMIAVTGPFPLMLIAAGVLCACVLLAVLTHRWQGSQAPAHKRAEAEKPLSKEGAFALIRSDRYLTYLALLTVVVNLATTSADFIFGSLLVEHSIALFGDSDAAAADRGRFVGGIYGRLYSYINLAGFLTQMLLVSRIFKYVGIANSLFVHPLIAFTGNLLMIGNPSIRVAATYRVADASVDYSLDNTARQALWLPTSREAKYKAKQAVDSFFVRVGDMIQAGIVYAGTALSFSIHAFAALNLVMTVAWLAIVFKLRHMYGEHAKSPAAPAPRAA